MSANISSPNKIGLAERVLDFIRNHRLISGQETLVVGVSGGADSVCLLHLLVKLKDKLGVKLHAAHLNHMLRGAESDSDADYVSELARDLGVTFTVEQREVASHRTENCLSIEEAAREVRYQFLADIARSVRTNRIAVGHTADDQVETILMHLVRGTGAYGLQGMQPLTTWRLPDGIPLTVVRPLLELNRSETEAYCNEHRLNPHKDSSNLSSIYLRNRIRHELIPLLQSYNPNINEVLLRAAEALAGDTSFFQQQLSPIWSSVASEIDGMVVLNTKEVADLHPALQRYVIREAIRRLLGSLKDIEWRHVETIRAALSWPEGKQLSLPKGLTLYTEHRRSVITTNSTPPCPLPVLEGEHRLRVPGNTQFSGWQVIATIMESSNKLAQGFSPTNSGSEWVGYDSNDALAITSMAYLDFEAAGKSLTVRGRRPGDIFQPLGMSQPKKIQDFMVDAKIPQAWRDRLPLVCSPEHIIWIAGYRIDERVKVTEATKQILCLQMIPQPPKFASSS